MGCSINQNRHRKQLSLIQIKEDEYNISPKRVRNSQQIDLPYRHYISPSRYLASMLPHTKFQFKHHSKFILDQTIDDSSIIHRRFQEQQNGNQYFY